MTDAKDSLGRAQALLDQIVADNAKLADMIGFLDGAVDRVDELHSYVAVQGQQDTEAVLSEQPGAVTPPVANEDAAWEALVEHHDHLLRLLRVVTAALTEGLDDDEA